MQIENQESYKKLYGMGEIVLADDQQIGFDMIAAFLLNKESYFSLIGPAGTGKTTLMKKVVSEALKRRWHVLLTAPTHKAARQLAKSTGEEAVTIHKALGIAMTENSKTGELEYKVKGRNLVSNNTFMIVDEGSMVGDELLPHIKDAVNYIGAKCLFVGDRAQANPINESVSVAVDPERMMWNFYPLTKVHRQALDNPIIKLATAIREADADNLPIPETEINDSKGIVVMKPSDWAIRMAKACAKHLDDRYIGYNNAAVDAAAKVIRVQQYGDSALNTPYLAGESLIVNERYVYKFEVNEDETSRIVIENNTEFTADRVWKDGWGYRVSSIVEGEYVEFHAMDSYLTRKNYLNALRSKARKLEKEGVQSNPWGDFWNAVSHVADLRSSKALTIHKSQGSTFRDVYINMNQIYAIADPEERKRLYYVAVTRPSRALFVTGV